MKTINLFFENLEYDALIKVKGDKTWKQFVMTLATKRGDSDGEVHSS